MISLPYSAKLLWSFNFANFPPFAKIFQNIALTARASMDNVNILELSC